MHRDWIILKAQRLKFRLKGMMRSFFGGALIFRYTHWVVFDPYWTCTQKFRILSIVHIKFHNSYNGGGKLTILVLGKLTILVLFTSICIQFIPQNIYEVLAATSVLYFLKNGLRHPTVVEEFRMFWKLHINLIHGRCAFRWSLVVERLNCSNMGSRTASIPDLHETAVGLVSH